MSDLMILICNALVYILLTTFLIIKRKSNTSIFLMTIWSISSISSIIYYLLAYQFAERYKGDISGWALCYLACCFVICTYPLWNINKHHSLSVSGNEGILDFFAWFIVLFSFIPFCGNLIYALENLNNSQFETFADNYQNDIVVLTGAIGFLDGWSRLIFRIFIPILIIFQLQRRKTNTFLIIGLIIAFFNPILANLNVGSRYVFITDILYAILIYLLFSNSIRQSLRTKIKVYGTAAILSSAILFLLITFFRFGGEDKANDALWISLSLYTGEGFVNFSNNMWNTTNFTDGDNTVFLFKHFLGTYDESHRNWMHLNQKSGLLLNTYYTFIGDFYIDFGPYIPPCIMLLFAFVIYRNSKKSVTTGAIPFYNVVWIALLLRIYASGFTYYTYMNSPMEIIYVATVNIFIHFVSKKRMFYASS